METLDIFGDLWTGLTTNVLCMLAAIIVGTLLMVAFYAWWIHKVHEEQSWTHQPLYYKGRR